MTIERLPSGAYRIRVSAGTKNGGQRRRLSRTLPASTSKRELRKAELELEMQAERTTGDGDTLTLSDLVELWIGHQDGVNSAKTQANARSVVRCWLDETPIGAKLVADVRVADLEDYYRRITSYRPPSERPDGTVGAATVRQLHSRIRAALGYAERMGWIASNPAAHCSPADYGRRSRVKATDPAAYRGALDIADQIQPGLRAFILFLGQTGARKSEGLALRWDNIDGDVVTIEGSVSTYETGEPATKPTKTYRSRKLRIGAQLIDALESERIDRLENSRVAEVAFDPCGYVWSSDGLGARPWRPDTAGKWVKKSGVMAGELRHMAATHLLSGGVPIGVVADRLGHASPAMTLNVYQEALPVDDAAAADVLDQLGR